MLISFWHLQLVKPVARRVAVAVPKPRKRAEKPKDVEVIEISSDSDEEHAVQEKKAAAKKKTSVSYTSVLTARSKVRTFRLMIHFRGLKQSDSDFICLLLLFRLLVV